MASYTIEINEETPQGKSLLSLLRSLKGIVSIRPQKQAIAGIDEALQDVAKGRVHTAKDAQDLLSQCLK